MRQQKILKFLENPGGGGVRHSIIRVCLWMLFRELLYNKKYCFPEHLVCAVVHGG